MKQTLKMHFMTLLMLRYVKCGRAQEDIDMYLFSPSVSAQSQDLSSVKYYCTVVFTFQVFNGKDLTEEMTKIQSVLSDDKNDWEHRVAAVSILKK